MELGINNKVALISGGSRGIGKAVALALANEGVNVAIGARGNDELVKTSQEIKLLGVESLPVQMDVTKAEEVKNFVQKTADHFNRIDILINNAVSSYQNNFLDLTDEDWLYNVDTKLMGYVRCARECVPYMKKNSWGRIVNLSGTSGRKTTPSRMTSGTLNSAVNSFSKYLSDEVAQFGITVNVVLPGYTMTTRFQEGLIRHSELEGRPIEEIKKERLSLIPIGRFVQPNDLANLIVFLCSELTSAITGQAIAVDGGAVRNIIL